MSEATVRGIFHPARRTAASPMAGVLGSRVRGNEPRLGLVAVVGCPAIVQLARGDDGPTDPEKGSRNCWRIERATRAAVLTNADYFAALAASLTRARRLILLAGWDLDAL